MSTETNSVKILRLYAEWYYDKKTNNKNSNASIQEFIAEKIDSELTAEELIKSSSDYNSIMKLLGYGES